jgi:hypothetical protein
MSWRYHEHVTRGEIDNTARGRVTGRIWLAGIAEPFVLDLEGDCAPDLAGCRLAFENPAPIPMTTRPPAAQQRGVAGEITAARKVRVFDVPLEKALAMIDAGERPPEHLANVLRIEWFSSRSGVFTLETADFRLTISEPAWRFTPEEIAERERQIADADDATPFAIAIRADQTEGEWDEFRNEQLLRESDTMGERYRRLLEKYADHPEAERLIAHEMGWERLADLLDAEARGETRPPGNHEIDFGVEYFREDPPDPAREGIDWVRDEDGNTIHPVGKQARDALYALLDEVKAGGEDLSETDEAIGEFVGKFMTLSVKLRAHLDFIVRGDRLIDPAQLIAWLKRDLDIHNQTLAAACALSGHAKFSAERLAHYRAALFAIRDGILAVIARLRGGQAAG